MKEAVFQRHSNIETLRAKLKRNARFGAFLGELSSLWCGPPLVEEKSQ